MKATKLLCSGLVLLSMFLCTASFSIADPLDNWHWRYPLPQGNTLVAIAYGNGAFVAVGEFGSIVTSQDGVTWTNRISGTSDSLNGITYGNGTFVAVGVNGSILTSPGGVEWTKRTSGIADKLNDVVYGNSTFYAVGDGVILTSPDGVIWTTIFSGTPYKLRAVTYGNGTFVATGENGVILTSPGGVTWTIRISGTSNNLNGVTYGNGTFYAVGDSGILLTSPDGVSWTIRTSGTSYGLSGVTYAYGTFVAVGENGTILTSPDGVTWTSRTSKTTIPLSEVTYGNGTFVAVGDSGILLTSPDGVSWTIRTSGTSNLCAVTYGNGTFVAVGENGAILTSPDGVTWTTGGTSSGLFGVTYAYGTFVALGARAGPMGHPYTDYFCILTSPDGETWTERYSVLPGVYPGVQSLSGLTYGNGIFLVLRWTPVLFPYYTILTSPDGVTWTERTTLTSKTLHGVTYGNGTFVAVGENGAILTSPDGVTWTERTSGTSYGLSGVTYAYGIFVAVGGNGAILTSPDGVTWTERTSGTSYGLFGVTYAYGTFVAVGENGAILTSPDGVTWTERSPRTSKTLHGVTYAYGTFVAVGENGTILQSDQVITGIPHIYVNPASLNFGEVIGGNTSDKQVTVRNNGNADLIIGTITSPSPPFSKIADDCSGQTFAPGGSCTVTYQFSPTSAGSFSSNSNIPSNDPDENSVKIPLNGVGVVETITIPNILTGPISGATGTSYSYTAGGSTSNFGHSVEYQFDWTGDGSDLSPWGSTTQSKTWTVAGTYTVKARARCATHSSVISGWTSGLSVTISGLTETVSTPNPPNGPASGFTGTSYSYATGGSTSSLGHTVQYFFDWGDGTNSGWLPVGTTIASKSWTSAGSYTVKAQARCATDTWANYQIVT